MPHVVFMTKPKWATIETAPKDGSDIMLYCGPEHDPMWAIGSWDGDKGTWSIWWENATGYAERRHDWPTHWQHLPNPPSQ